ncbi:hypothetical protein BJY21_000957 [Kineosphaera limosa]|uniref:DUF7168 domain-containing protein n=1 Tax=Kineosphaera limosa NBRC 100340 TaxID=1184609 RepID=K6VI29_9MICO|nr:hypothetical protein [Kineosphaera limosa]NYD99772.1 hypothetical protein [Kineosphaera limosa]GAB95873.1 hypothetical protein KILIM_028_00270 [Kineosphaera limosa NBRC 100340]
MSDTRMSDTETKQAPTGRPNQPKLALIADLLARAEDPNTTTAERELSLQRAQREAARHGIDLAEAAYAQAQRGRPMEPEERRVDIGTSGTPGLKIYADLFLALAQINDLKCLITMSGSHVFAHGMPSDLDMAEAMYASLLVQMNIAAEQWLATGEYQGEARAQRVWSRADRAYRPGRPHKGVARRNFQRGFIGRIAALLQEQKEEARREAEEASQAARAAAEPTANHRALTTTALALRAKSEAVDAYHAAILAERKIRRHYNGQQGGQGHVTAHLAGRAAADRADTTRRGTRGLPSGRGRG